jgi:gas vesicle protein
MAEYDEGYVIIERRTGNFGTFVWGLLMGAGAALLFAPKSGRETREELGDSFTRVREDTEDRFRHLQDTVNATVDDMRRQFEEGVDQARRVVESGREAARAGRDEMERRMEDTSEAYRSGYEAARSAPSPDDGGGPTGDGDPDAGA